MRHDLMPEEVEIDPVIRGTTLPTAKQTAIESAGLCKVPDGKGKMKAGPLGHAGWPLWAGSERSKSGG
jgi:hypothetical protein